MQFASDYCANARQAPPPPYSPQAGAAKGNAGPRAHAPPMQHMHNPPKGNPPGNQRYGLQQPSWLDGHNVHYGPTADGSNYGVHLYPQIPPYGLYTPALDTSQRGANKCCSCGPKCKGLGYTCMGFLVTPEYIASTAVAIAVICVIAYITYMEMTRASRKTAG